MKTLIFYLSGFSFLFFFSCSDDSPTNSSFGSYKYTGYDSSGNKIISGYLWFESFDSSYVKGTWDFKLLSNKDNFGPQIGRGQFEGMKDTRGSLRINLNPEWIDNNVLLDGSILISTYRGSWSYIGFPGVINKGTFEAHRIL